MNVRLETLTFFSSQYTVFWFRIMSQKCYIFRVFFTSKKNCWWLLCVHGVHSLPENYTFTIPCSATYFLEVGARISLKVATKRYPRGKKSSEKLHFQVVFLKQKCKSANKKFGMFLINFTLLYLIQLHIFWK